MERLGVNAMLRVLPTVQHQRHECDTVPNLLLVNNTYKPLNWYVYGQIPDIMSTDPYAPGNGRQLDTVRYHLSTAREASTPRPLIAVLWATSIEGNNNTGRPPSPEEERMMVYYALGAGAKGVGYFADFDIETGEGKFYAASNNPPLWHEMGRLNRDMRCLAPYLSIGCPIPDFSVSDNKYVWTSTILCGPEEMVVIVVNEQHHIAYNTRDSVALHEIPLNVELKIPLPKGFGRCRVREIIDGNRLDTDFKRKRKEIIMNLDEVDTARAFLISAE